MLATSSFRLISIVGVLLAAGAAAAHYLLFALRAPGAERGSSPRIKRFTLWERLLMLVTFGCLACLALTGFFGVFCGGLHGYVLMLHVTFAPPFIMGMLALVLTWAHEHRFEPHDMQWLSGHGCLKCGHHIEAGKFDLPQKIYFWCLAILTVVLIVSSVGSMLPLAGTEWQVLLADVHRWAALVLLMATIVHLYNRTLARPGAWLSWLTGTVRLNWAKRYHQRWARTFASREPTATE